MARLKDSFSVIYSFFGSRRAALIYSFFRPAAGTKREFFRYRPRMRTKLAAGAAILLCLLAITVTLWPASTGSEDCGTWISPTWTREHTDSVIASTSQPTSSAQLEAIGESIAFRAEHVYNECSENLARRRTYALMFVSLSVVVALAAVLTRERKGQVLEDSFS